MKKQATITSSIIVVLIILGGLVYWSLNKNHTFYNNENINENDTTATSTNATTITNLVEVPELSENFDLGDDLP